MLLKKPNQPTTKITLYLNPIPLGMDAFTLLIKYFPVSIQ